MTISKPQLGQLSWGSILNSALDALDSGLSAETAARAGADATETNARVSGDASTLASSRARTGQLTALTGALSDAVNCVGVQVLGDSTGDETTEWVYNTAQYLAAQYPAYTVKYRLWDDTSQDYLAPVVLQTGPQGEMYASFPAKSLSIAAAQVTHIGGDIDLRADVALDDWTPASNQTIMARYGSAGNRAWRWYVGSTGAMTFEWSTDGTALIAKSSTNPGFVDGSRNWVRVTLDVDNGASGNDVKFYTSSDGATWNQLGSTITTGSTTSIFNPSSQAWEMGARGTNGERMSGKVYEVGIRNGLNGPTCNPRFPDAWTRPDDTSATFTGSPTLYIVNASKSGAGISYLNDSTRLPLMCPDYSQVACFLNSSHNEAWTTGPALNSLWSAWITAVKARLPFAALVAMTQNPRYSPASNIREMNIRHGQIAAIARQNGIGVIDTFKAFVADPRGSALIATDGIHPTHNVGDNQGALLWASVVQAAIAASI